MTAGGMFNFVFSGILVRLRFLRAGLKKNFQKPCNKLFTLGLADEIFGSEPAFE
jgi:hypothetical protein